MLDQAEEPDFQVYLGPMVARAFQVQQEHLDGQVLSDLKELLETPERQVPLVRLDQQAQWDLLDPVEQLVQQGLKVHRVQRVQLVFQEELVQLEPRDNQEELVRLDQLA